MDNGGAMVLAVLKLRYSR